MESSPGNYSDLQSRLSEWCPEPDLNRHDRNDREILSLLCLPISPPGQRAKEYHVQSHFGGTAPLKQC